MLLQHARRLHRKTSRKARGLAVILSGIIVVLLASALLSRVQSAAATELRYLDSGFKLGVILVFTLILGAVAMLSFLLICVDFHQHRLPNDATAALALIGYLYLICYHVAFIAVPAESMLRSLGMSLLCALLYPAIMAVLFILNRNGIGLGDVKLAVGLGAIVAPFGFLAVCVAFVAALVLACVSLPFLMIRSRQGFKTRIAFGPWMLVGASIAAFMS